MLYLIGIPLEVAVGQGSGLATLGLKSCQGHRLGSLPCKKNWSIEMLQYQTNRSWVGLATLTPRLMAMNVHTTRKVQQIGLSAWHFRRKVTCPSHSQHLCACMYCVSPTETKAQSLGV